MNKQIESKIARRNGEVMELHTALKTSITLSLLLILFAFSSLTMATQAQEVSIPDPGLNAAIRDALQKPIGPFTTTDLLGLTNLSARSRMSAASKASGA